MLKFLYSLIYWNIFALYILHDLLIKVILKAHSMDTKQVWVKKMRQLIQDTYFGNSSVAAIPSLSVNLPQSRGKHSQRSSRYSLIDR